MVRIEWFLASLLALTTGRVLIDELAIEIARRAPMGSA